MTGIVERLRASAKHSRLCGWSTHALLDEQAADEIERLRELNTPASRKLLNITKALLHEANAEIERLRNDLKVIPVWPEKEGR